MRVHEPIRAVDGSGGAALISMQSAVPGAKPEDPIRRAVQARDRLIRQAVSAGKTGESPSFIPRGATAGTQPESTFRFL